MAIAMARGVILAAVAMLAAWPALAADAIGEVVRVRGDVAAERAGATTPLAIGAPLYAADTIVTGSDARAHLGFIDGTVLSVGSNSRVAIVEYQVDEDGSRTARFSLVEGILRATVDAVAPDGSSFSIDTAIAVASARSTDWIVEALPDKTSVFVVDGTVWVAQRHVPEGLAILGPDQGIDVTDLLDLPSGGGSSDATAPLMRQVERWSRERAADVIARTTVQ